MVAVGDHVKLMAFPDDHIETCLDVLGKDKQKEVTETAYQKCFAGLSEQILSRSRRLFNELLKNALKSYSTTYEDDKALIASTGKKGARGLLAVELSYHDEVAIRYRMSQKRLLSLLIVEHGARTSASENKVDRKNSKQEKKRIDP